MSFMKVLEEFTFQLPSTGLAVHLDEGEVVDVITSDDEDQNYLQLLVQYEFIRWVTDETG